MKRLAATITTGVVLGLALVLAGCAPVADPHKDAGLDARLAGQWVLDRAADHAGAISGVYASLTIGHGTASTGRGPCTDYTARIVGEPGAVFVSATPRQHPGCADRVLAKLDARYLDALRATELATVGADTLSLRGTSTTLTFHRAPYVSAVDFIDVVWNAETETFGDWESKRFADNGPTMTTVGTMVLSKDGTFSAEVNGCGPAVGTWAIDAGEVVVTRTTTAEIHCTSQIDADRLAELLDAVDNGFQFTRTTNAMVTTNPRTLDSVRFALPPKVVF